MINKINKNGKLKIKRILFKRVNLKLMEILM